MNAAAPRGASSRWLGGLALAFFAAHAAAQWQAGQPRNLLWACHAADLGVGLGVLCGWRRLTAAATLMLVVGLPMWLMSLAAGGAFYPTSALTHVGGLAIGLISLRRERLAPQAWLFALALVAALLVAARLATPPRDNVNLAFALWLWPNPWPQLPEAYLLLVLALWGVFLRIGQALLEWPGWRRGLERACYSGKKSSPSFSCALKIGMWR